MFNWYVYRIYVQLPDARQLTIAEGLTYNEALRLCCGNSWSYFTCGDMDIDFTYREVMP